MTIEDEIRACYKLMGVSLSDLESPILGGGYNALSQYCYTLAYGFETREAAEQYAIGYYRERMNLIRQ
jgi:hypothetical protein